ncbi:MAG: 1-deoxy-D-xylulose-5-phosphate reductoisomerase, partial [Chloroflexota bacterium]
SSPDMRLPIQYALFYPERLTNPQLSPLDFSLVANLSFEPPDTKTFPCLGLAVAAGEKGGTCPAVLCGADEVAVKLFLAGRIRFTDIPRLVEQTLRQHENVRSPSIDEIIAADNWAREKTRLLATGDISC